MHRLDKLKEQDMIESSHFPVIVLFNDLYEEQFVDTLTHYIIKGHGFGANYGACVFPDDLDEYDIVTGGTFDGVEFGLHDGEEVVLDYCTFYYYLEIVCNRYLENNLQDMEVINNALDTFRSIYKVFK